MAQDSFSYKVTIESNLDAVKEQLEQDTERILYAMGVTAVGGAVLAISGGATQAVDTGRLRASISFVTAEGQRSTGQRQTPKSGQTTEKNPLKSGDLLSGKAPEKSVIVGSNVEYASYVELGTSKMDARPFLRNGIENTRDEMKEIAKGILKGEY